MSDGYYEMDDVTIKASESEEQLRKQHDDSYAEQAGVRVTRTTEITVSTNAQLGNVRSGIHLWSPAEV